MGSSQEGERRASGGPMKTTNSFRSFRGIAVISFMLAIPSSLSFGATSATEVAALGFVSAPQSVLPGACSGAVVVGVVNSSGQFIKTTWTELVTATGTGATIYRDNKCTQ